MAKVLVTMPDEFLNKVDGLADSERLSRSELIRTALKNYMRKLSKNQIENASRNAEILEDILG
jgi:metal-responsive CopG/Arc/MetJ family transcriptional regulator